MRRARVSREAGGGWGAAAPQRSKPARPRAAANETSFGSGPQATLWSACWRYRGALLAGSAFLLATNALALAIPWQLQVAIDGFRSDSAGAGALALRSALLLATLAITGALTRIASRILVFNSGRNVEYDLRRRIFDHLLVLPPAYFAGHPVGDLMSRLTSDLMAVRVLVGFGALNVVNTTFVYLLTIGRMVSLDARLTLLALLPFPAIVIVGRLTGRSMFKRSRDVADELGKLSSRIQEDLAGVQVVKGYALEGARQATFVAQNDAYAHMSMRLVIARGLMGPLLGLLAAIGTLVVLWGGGAAVVRGELTLGQLTAFQLYLLQLAWPTLALGFILSVFQRGKASWARLCEVLTEEPARDTAAPPARPIEGALSLRGLTVHRGGRPVLEDITLDIPAGATVAIVGRTGAGKSTLVEALCRMIEVPPGSLLVDGVDVGELPLATLRGAIGYAPQEAFLFSESIRDNVRFGLRAPSGDAEANARVEAAVRDAGLERDLQILPEGLDTIVGERGISLSGGQRQRVALARALASDPRILILDDSMSAVDAETEKAVLERLRAVLRGRTSILVSHRIAAVRQADQIVVLEGGRLAERGTHDELVEKGGIYADLYQRELLAASLEAA